MGWGGTQTFEEEALGQEGAMRLCTCWESCKLDSATAWERNCSCRGEAVRLGERCSEEREAQRKDQVSASSSSSLQRPLLAEPPKDGLRKRSQGLQSGGHSIPGREERSRGRAERQQWVLEF